MDKTFLLYADAGAGDFSLQAANTYFSRFGTVRQVMAADIIERACFEGADALILPGGADLPYCNKLAGAGNNAIRTYVEEGGLYIGLCAGAYYACAHVEYHKGRADEICGGRDLGFYRATAIGSLPEIASFYDDTLATAAVTPLICADGETRWSYYHGGCAFHPEEGETAQILARYAGLSHSLPAIITKKIGQGRILLSGVHAEVNAEILANHPHEQAPPALITALESKPLIDITRYLF